MIVTDHIDHKEKHCIGLIEAIGLASAIEAADTAVKSANVKLLGYEYSGYSARIVVKVEGKMGEVKRAVEAATKSTYTVKGTLVGCQSNVCEGALDGNVYHMLIHNRLTVGDPLQVASGKRPQGTGRQAKIIGKWNPVGCYIRE